MKKLMSSILCITMLLTMFSGTVVFATEDIESSLADETTVEETIEETVTDEEILLDGDYEITTIGDSYYAVGMEYRDVEIFITDGVNPIADAAVTLNGVTVCTDDSGIAEFVSVPTSFEEYTVSVSSSFGEKETILLVSSSEKIEDLDNIDLTVKAVISYWTPGTVVSSDSGTASLTSHSEYDATGVDGWVYEYFGITSADNLYYIDPYLYIIGNVFIAYNIEDDIDTYMTTVSYDYIVECDGELYAYYAGYNDAGGEESYYSAHWNLYKYNTNDNDWDKLNGGDSNGIYDSVGYSDGQRIISIGGNFIDDDTSVKQYYDKINIYDTTSNTNKSQFLCSSVAQDTYELDNKLYSYHSDGIVTVIDLDTYDSGNGTYEIETINNMTSFYYEGQSAVYNDGKIYLIGGTDAPCSIRIFDCETYEITYSNSLSLISGKTCSVIYEGCIYAIQNRFFYIYDIGTDTLTSMPETSVEFDCAAAILIANKIYAAWVDGEAGIYEIKNTDTIIDNDTIASGKYHTLKIVDGEVYACGDNSYGQLGTGNTTSTTSYTKVPGLTNVMKVAAGWYSSYAITESGVLYGWGSNGYGQLGLGTTTSVKSPTVLCSDVSELGEITDVKAGYYHTIILDSNGDMLACGYNYYGQIGSTSSTIQRTPINVASDVVLISAGGNRTYYEDSNGALYGLGSDVGDDLSTVSSPKQVVCGTSHTVAIDSNNEMYVWGSNSKKQLCVKLSDGSTSTSTPYATGIVVDKVDAYGNSTAFCINGNLYVSDEGGYTSNYYDRVTVISNAVDIALGGTYSVVTDSSDNIYRFRFITDSKDASFGEVENILDIPSDVSFTALDAYRTQTLAIAANGDVYAWGEGYYADGTDSTVIEPKAVKIDGLENIVQVSRGKNHNLALDEDGYVWGWGSNSNYPMGGTSGKYKVATKISGVSDVKQIEAGTEFSIFLLEDGTLMGVGKNDSGQLGTTEVTTYEKTPVTIASGLTFTDVSVGEAFVVAISDGDVYTWGENGNGQLGDGTTTNNSTPTKLNISLEDDEYFTDVSAGVDYCLALTNLGNVYAWGNNGDGELGRGSTTENKTPGKVDIENVAKIIAGRKCSLFINSDGELYVTGAGDDGKFGSVFSKSSTPSRVSAINNIDAMDATLGYNFCIYLCEDGTLKSAGNNSSGQLGVYSYEAVQITE